MFVVIKVYQLTKKSGNKGKLPLCPWLIPKNSIGYLFQYTAQLSLSKRLRLGGT